MGWLVTGLVTLNEGNQSSGRISFGLRLPRNNMRTVANRIYLPEKSHMGCSFPCDLMMLLMKLFTMQGIMLEFQSGLRIFWAREKALISRAPVRYLCGGSFLRQDQRCPVPEGHVRSPRSAGWFYYFQGLIAKSSLLHVWDTVGELPPVSGTSRV